jgi:predicted MFS family arabinose efflux permease
LGNIAGAILGGALLAMGWTPRDTLIGLALAPFLTAALMVFLRRARETSASADVAALAAATLPPR